MIKNEFLNKSRSYLKPKSNVPAFLVKTYDILENPAHSDIISWNKEGTAFIVKNVNEFSEKILPKYFKHNNFSSFVRQLNMYDFHKSKQDSKENEFKHKLFRRGQRHLLGEIKRKGSENHHFNEDQMSTGSGNAELNKAKRNMNTFNEELSSVKTQQGELERIGKAIYSQNTQLLNENKLLWDELSKNKEKYEKKIEKMIMFVYSVMHQGNEAIGAGPNKKMLPTSENMPQDSSLISPESLQKNILPFTPETKDTNKTGKEGTFFPDTTKPEGSLDPLQGKMKSPPLLSTPTPSGISTLPNTPGMIPMMGMQNFQPIMTAPAFVPNMGYPSNMINTGNAPNVSGAHNTYNAQPYFQENIPQNNSPNMNQTATTSGNYFRKDNNGNNAKLSRPAPSMELPESKEFKENPVKILKKEPETAPTSQNSLLIGNLPSFSGLEDPTKSDDWLYSPNLTRGPSYNGGDISFSRFNSLNVPRVPSSLDVNFSQWPLFPQNLKNNGDSNGLNPNKLESEGVGKSDSLNEEGVPSFSPNGFARNAGGIGGFSFGQTPDDALYRN